MGSVCGSTLALMDAGVPIAAPVSGIAMGLVKEGDDYVILTDIQGAEDHLGDMDFKVAGTRDGITALQMDIKITGVTQEIMRSALEQAKRARVSILETMLAAIPEPRSEMADHAPRISTVKIDPEFIGMVIGKGGETIRALEAEYEVQIDIEEDGTILVYATEGTKGEAASCRDPRAHEVARRSETRTRAGSSRRPTSVRSSSSRRARTACSTSRTSGPGASRTSRT